MKHVLLPFYLTFGGTLSGYHLSCLLIGQTSILFDSKFLFVSIALVFTLAYIAFRRLARNPRGGSSGKDPVIDPFFRKLGFMLIGLVLFAVIFAHVVMVIVPKPHAMPS